MEKLEILQTIKFGERIAEEELENLKRYFVMTEDWRRLFSGEIDVIYGTKGSGKSALYSMLDSRYEELFSRKILLTAAENPRGNTVFEGLSLDPPTSEVEFIRLWKLYFLIITVCEFDKWGIENQKLKEIKSTLEGSALLPVQRGLKAILKACMDYVRQIMRIESLQPSIGLNEATAIPNSVYLKISFREPTATEIGAGIKSIDSIYEMLEEALTEIDFVLWIAVDRLDVAFSDNIELETNALRALFKAYRDLTPFSHLQIKIFLRDDIWQRITADGFREASHITKTLTILWNKETMVNLIIKRLLSNEDFVKLIGIEVDSVFKNYAFQENVFYRFFPEQIEIGARKTKTIEWILGRVRDGKGIIAPREVIHLFNESKQEQIKRIQIGQNELEGENIIGRSAFKAALGIVSKVRLEQTIYAEYPSLKQFIQLLEGEKTDQQIETLSQIWSTNAESTKAISKRLVDIGFFEEKGDKENPRFWVPFIYRNELNMVQGSADFNE